MKFRTPPVLLCGWALLTAAPLQASEESTDATPHLVPMPPFVEEYDRVVFDLLIGARESEFWMLVKPSFSPEYSLVISKKKSGGAGQVREYEVRWSQPVKSIWQLGRFSSPGSVRATPRISVKIDQRKVSIPADLVDDYFAPLWRFNLNAVRTPESGYSLGLDGTTYGFFARPNQYGEIWQPRRGAPRKLAELGECLIVFVRATEAERGGRLANCTELASEFKVPQEKRN